MKNNIIVSVFMGAYLFSASATSSTDFNGLIINNSSSPLAERIVDLLTPRWHFSRNISTSNLVIQDIFGGPASQKIEFLYDGKIIKRYTLPRARIKPGSLGAVADEVYKKTVLIDISKRSDVLDRIGLAR